MKHVPTEMKDTVPLMVVTNWNIIEILKSFPLSIREKYFQGNSEAYGNLQHEESQLENPAISYFIGDA
jgi:hypothetical protein